MCLPINILHLFHVLVIVLVGLISSGLWAEEKDFSDIILAPVFKAGMVLPRDVKVPVWGKAEPGQSLWIHFDGQNKTTTAAADGTWKLELDPMPANSKNQALVVNYHYPKGYTWTYDDLVLEDVLVGDLWLVSGQSNMEFGISLIETSAQELADAGYPQIRTLLMPKNTAVFPVDEVRPEWLPADRDSLTLGGWGGFSGVGFVFGRQIHKETGVPIGLIQAAFGGAYIQAFIPRDEFRSNKNLGRDLRAIQNEDDKWKAAKAVNTNAAHAWDGITAYNRLKPSICYNAMIAPVLSLPLKGVLWYQGEANMGYGKVYTQYMNALIHGLRVANNNPQLPFFFAQIAPFKYGGSLPGMWESQFAVLLDPLTGVVLTHDVGNYEDIHPTKKREVGERFALQALAKVYGKTSIDPDGPVAASIQRQGDKVIITFNHAEGGLKTTDGKSPSGFRLGKKDVPLVMVPAISSISGTTVTLSASGVENPEIVQYAWEDNPTVNLVDLDGLPARPFSLPVKM